MVPRKDRQLVDYGQEGYWCFYGSQIVSRLWIRRILVLLFVQVIWCVIKNPTRNFCLENEQITPSGICEVIRLEEVQDSHVFEGLEEFRYLGATSCLTLLFLLLVSIQFLEYSCYIVFLTMMDRISICMPNAFNALRLFTWVFVCV